MPITTLEIAWLAGILEGEGSFMWHNYDRHPRVKLAMTDADVVLRASRLIGTRCRGPYFGRGTGARPKPLYELGVTGPRAVGVMLTIFPFMGLRRRAKIAEVISLWRARIMYRPGGKPGEQNHRATLTEASVRSIRERFANGESVLSLADEHGVSWTATKMAIDGRSWKHVR